MAPSSVFSNKKQIKDWTIQETARFINARFLLHQMVDNESETNFINEVRTCIRDAYDDLCTRLFCSVNGLTTLDYEDICRR